MSKHEEAAENRIANLEAEVKRLKAIKVESEGRIEDLQEQVEYLTMPRRMGTVRHGQA